MSINIYVLDRGFVLVGIPEPSPERGPLWVTFTRCAVVRVWGTTAGLGQLAREGPTSKTILDEEPAGTAINLDYCLRVTPCDEQAWSKWAGTTSPSGPTSARKRG